MERRSIRRGLVAAATIVVLSVVTAYADTVPADGDALTAGPQKLVVLPDATPGQVVTWPVTFALTCTDGLTHVAAGSTIRLDLASANVPGDGHVSATSTTIGPVPATWPLSGQDCPSPAPTVASDAPSTVTMTMPTTPGDSYLFTLTWSRFGVTGLAGSSAMTFQVNVVGNTPPVLHLPTGKLVEATSPAGATVTWTASATDAEDATPPTPTCAPDSGSTFPLGSTTVKCSVTDGGGLKDSGSFLVTVQDTTPPKLSGMPGDQAVTTGDPAGAVVTFATPTATDAADPSPTVGCTPTSGSVFAVGKTTVTCTAQDTTGNHAAASFDVTVTFVPPVVWTAVWGEPVATSGGTFVANPGRTVPVKVDLFADGVEQTSGAGMLVVTTCAGAAAVSVPLTWDGGRWTGHLDTSSLAGPGCYQATAGLDGHAAGSFHLDLKGADATPVANGPNGRGKS